MKEKIKVLVHPSDRTGVSYFRSTRPHIALEEMYPDEFHIDIDYDPKYNDDNFLKQYDIIHYHRTFGPYEQMKNWEEIGADGKPNGIKHEGTTERLARLGIIGIMDLDDYWAPGTHHPAYLIIKENKLDIKLIENIKVSQYVMTTTPIFAKEMHNFNKNTLVVPNAIDPNEKQYTPNPEPSDRIRIGWLGGSSHLRDLEILNGVVQRLKNEKLLDKVQFVLCGFDTRGTITTINEQTKEQTVRKIQPHESVWTKYEQIFTDNYSTVSPEYKEFLLKYTKDEWPNVKNEPYRRVWTKPISTYATNYNLFDISLAPLEENIFNKVKSQLKVIEAGFHKKALIAQKFGAYEIDAIEAYERGGTINPNGNMFLIDSVKNHKEWYELIKRLIKNPELISQLGSNLYDTVKDTYSIEATTRLRADIYRKLFNK
jgi:glycosyltransferase involved in cell wall biosynthesis